MSFLTRSKLNLSESSSNLFSRLDDKSKNISISQQKTDLMASLDDFRQGLRRQLSDKLKINPEVNSTNKFVGIPSPKRNQESMKDRLEGTLWNKQRGSPFKGGITPLGRSNSALMAKSSERKHDFVKELTKKLEGGFSPHKHMPSKELKLSTSLEKKINGQSVLLSSGYRTSFDNREKSPLREYASNFDLKSPDRKTPYAIKPSFLNEKSINYTPKDKKQSLIKILDHSITPNGVSSTKLDTERSNISLTQQLNQLRSSRIILQPQSPEKREEINYKPNRYSTDNLKTLSTFVNDSFKQKERDRSGEKYGTKKSILYSTNLDINGTNQDKSSTINKLPLSKIYEIQDIFCNISDKELNQLPSEYFEELIKLSSIIMQRVKGFSH